MQSCGSLHPRYANEPQAPRLTYDAAIGGEPHKRRLFELDIDLLARHMRVLTDGFANRCFFNLVLLFDPASHPCDTQPGSRAAREPDVFSIIEVMELV